VAHLAEIGEDRLPALLRGIPAPWGLRLRHVVTETARTRAAATALARRDLKTLGRLLVEGHRSLREDYVSSCPEADFLVDALVRHGAYGARLTGAGWGGAVIALLPQAHEESIVAEVGSAFREAFGRVPAAWSTRAGAGARTERK
jgi:galactokinase